MGRNEVLAGSCKTETVTAERVRNPIPQAVSALTTGFKSGRWASHIEPVPIPSKSEVIDLIEQVQRILFPGFFSPVILRPENLEYHLGQTAQPVLRKPGQPDQLGHPPRLLPPQPGLHPLQRTQL